MVDLGRSGKVTFTFRCNTPRQVYLVGNFNQWDRTATPMHVDDKGVWHVSLKLSPGSHQFRYWEGGEVWHTDYAACGVVRNEFGGFNSLVEVEPPIRLKVMPEDYAFAAPSRVLQ